jgi:AcrR family transcriptional regulator
MKLPDQETLPRRPRGRPRAEDVAELEGRLLDMAFQEFVAHGYGGTSLSRIVKAAGISKTTLYARYSSKVALLRAIVERQTEAHAAVTALRSPKGPHDLAAGLKAYANRTLEISLGGELLHLNRLIYGEAGRFPELGRAAAERTQRGIDDVAVFIRTCADAANLPCRDARGLAEAFIFMLRGWYVDVLLAGRGASARERQRWVDTAVGVLLAGLRA